MQKHPKVPSQKTLEFKIMHNYTDIESEQEIKENHPDDKRA